MQPHIMYDFVHILCRAIAARHEMLELLITVSTSIWLQACQSVHALSSVALLQLHEMNTSNNQLTGTLPSSWGSLEQVRMLSPLLLNMHCQAYSSLA